MITDAAREVILAFAVDEHLMGQAYTEWIGVAPFLEEDLAFASIGQDELGHAALLYAVIVGDDDAAIDEIAFFRDADEWRSCSLVERTLPEWEHALIRHWLYDAAEELRWQLFADSTIPELASASVRALAEERFHRRHADAMLDALLTVDDARDRLTVALVEVLPDAIRLFEPVAGEPDAIEAGVLAGPLRAQLPRWAATIGERFPEVDVPAFEDSHLRTGRHPDFAPLLARLREVLDIDRSAVW